MSQHPTGNRSSARQTSSWTRFVLFWISRLFLIVGAVSVGLVAPSYAQAYLYQIALMSECWSGGQGLRANLSFLDGPRDPLFRNLTNSPPRHAQLREPTNGFLDPCN
jgi:hypothetical protein